MSAFTRSEWLAFFDLPEAHWADHAACKDMDPALFFPEPGEPADKARVICMGCPVRIACRDYARETNQRHGVWGGEVRRERDRRRNSAA